MLNLWKGHMITQAIKVILQKAVSMAHMLCYSMNKLILLLQPRISTLYLITDTSPVS